MSRILTEQEIQDENWVYLGDYINPFATTLPKSKPYHIDFFKSQQKSDKKIVLLMLDMGYAIGPVKKVSEETAPHLVGLYRPRHKFDICKVKIKLSIKYLVKDFFILGQGHNYI